MEKLLNNKIDELKERLIDDVIQVVKIPSIRGIPHEGAPFGEQINKALLKALEISETLGFNVKNIDGYMGYAQYGEGDDYIGVVGHLDVVSIEDGWINDPFSGYIENERIYSRGILDNKAPIMSALYALYAIKELKLEITKPVRIIFGTNEESGFEDINYYLTKEEPPIMGFTPDCKYPVVYGEKGRAVIDIEAKVTGENYDAIIMEFFEFINNNFLSSNEDGDRLGINYRDSEFGTMQIRNYKLNSYKGKVSFSVTLSYPAICTIDEIIGKIKEKVTDNLTVKLIQNNNPVRFEKDCLMVKLLQEAYEEVTNLDGTPVTTNGGTYSKVMPNIVPFGPSFPGQKGIAHNPNEYMDISDIILNAKIYANAIYKLAK